LAAPVAPGERLRFERMLAGARLFLAIVSVAAIYLDPTEPARYSNLAYGLIGVYVAYSAVVVLLLRSRSEVGRLFARSIHAVDVLFPATIALFTEGPNSPFFFFFFPLLAAAFRWGFRATFFTALAGDALLMLQAGLITYSSAAGRLVEGQFDVNRLIMRATYLLMMGLLLGYAAEQEKQLRAENMTVARLAEKVRSAEGSLSTTLQEVFGELMRIFSTSRIAAVVRDAASGRVFLWDGRYDPQSHQPHLHLIEPEFEEREALLTPVPGSAWHAVRQPDDQGQPQWEITALEHGGKRVRTSANLFRRPIPGESFSYPSFYDSGSVLGVSFSFGESWSGRLIVVDPQLHSGVENELRFAQNLLQQVGPAIYNLYLVRRLRSRAGAIERARTARELHDGAIQSLIAAEMQVDVLRRRATAAADPVGKELEHIQHLLRQEVLGLRELMQQMKPVDVTPHDVLDVLADTVDRFRRDTGIDAQFVSEMEEVPLPSRVCRELVRITQEALVNIRKHSGASNVIVRFQPEGGRWKLVIEDDGRGFVFAGRFNGAQLQAKHQGPTVIRERVRSIGGELIIESAPGQGSRLEIAVPQQPHAMYA
jgi:signal transduction histidine kinase